MTKYTIETEPKEVAFTVSIFPLSAWVLMLVLGSLGHRLAIPYLFKFGYLECVLLVFALRLLNGPSITKHVIKEVTEDN